MGSCASRCVPLPRRGGRVLEEITVETASGSIRDGEENKQSPMDIVILEGLNPHHMNLAYGVRGIIGAESPGSRIWMLDQGYDCNWFYEAPSNDVVQMSRGVLSNLLSARASQEGCQRPIVFIGIAIGGILVKQAILLAHIVDEFKPIKDFIKGVVFLGTPHKEDKEDDYARILARIAKACDPYPEAVDGVSVNSGYFRQLTSHFRNHLGDLPVYTITQPELLVSEESATLGCKGEVHISLDVQNEQGHDLRGLREVSRCIQRIECHTTTTNVVESKSRLQNPYSVNDLPPESCPVCSSMPPGLPVGTETRPLEYLINLDQPAQDDLRLWARCCVVAHFAYRVSSVWLGRDTAGVKRDRGVRDASLMQQEACFGKVGPGSESWSVERRDDGG
ncbi:hypothetical protein B0H67DRAFT_322084 [Lasiosphaeris hirsuta]|uniref:Uncharacterized protein n=1 Tax=Lasiosphaeris hirsuta TaxID=260670 RepID=A0AA40DNL1_9PEZI|nr:hypothetical protein B0H67DRAFT_322084 [Lasiosphaeris hirsuta]